MGNHLSDPTIIEDVNGDIVCYYRECIYNVSDPQTNIYKMRSADRGVTWGDKINIISEKMKECDIISPSAQISISKGLNFYFCLKNEDEIKLMYVEGELADKKCWQEIKIEDKLPSEKILWHVSHINCHNKDVLLLTLADAFGGSNSELYLGYINPDSKNLEHIEKVEINKLVEGIKLEYSASGIIKVDKLVVCASVLYEDMTWGGMIFEEEKFDIGFCE